MAKIDPVEIDLQLSLSIAKKMAVICAAHRVYMPTITNPFLDSNRRARAVKKLNDVVIKYGVTRELQKEIGVNRETV